LKAKKIICMVVTVAVTVVLFVYVTKGDELEKNKVLGQKELASESADSCDIVDMEGEKDLVENKNTHADSIKTFVDKVNEESKKEVERKKEEEKKEEEKRKKKEEEEKKKKEEEEKKSEANKIKSKLSDDDMNLFYHIVEAEAGGEDIKGRILVANVILNRIKSSKFPNSLKSVIYAGKQFSPVSDGRLWRVKVSSGTKQAVKKALDGEDYSQGALYFMERSLAASSATSWFDRSLTRLFRYGCHEFFK